MQYILTEEEYQAKIGQSEVHYEKLQNTINDLCRIVADHMPTEWKPGVSEPWGCIRSNPKGTMYCDLCPVRDTCKFQFKTFSK